MDAEKISKMIKIRSGKSLKVKVMEQVEKAEGDHSAFFIFLANALCKLTVMMSPTEKEKFKIENDQFVVIKNMEHCLNVNEIPIFQTTNSSAVSVTKVGFQKTLMFSEEEVNNIVQTKFLEYISKEKIIKPTTPTSSVQSSSLRTGVQRSLNLDSYLRFNKDFEDCDGMVEVSIFSFLLKITLPIAACGSGKQGHFWCGGGPRPRPCGRTLCIYLYILHGL